MKVQQWKRVERVCYGVEVRQRVEDKVKGRCVEEKEVDRLEEEEEFRVKKVDEGTAFEEG